MRKHFDIPFENQQYGFRWGAATVTRLFSEKRHGWIIIEIRTPKCDWQVYVTRTGKVRVFARDGELSLTPKSRG